MTASRIVIRSERSSDIPLISGIVRRAYADIAYSDHREHLMIERLRATTAYIPALSLLAEIDGEAVGHILLTRATINGEHGAVPSLALAPLSVVPEWQAQGVGKQLVATAHREAARLGHGSIILVGNAGYYPRFGYEPLARYPIVLPFAAPPEESMILPLAPGSLDGVSGMVHYAPGWLEHE